MYIANTGSDLSLTEDNSVRVVFSCDGQFVTFQFILDEKYVGEPLHLSRRDAVKIGKQVAETGIYEQFPIRYVSLNDVRTFGLRLRTYGENGE
jgi:hypothetical protein